MFPRVLSDNLISLLPGQERMCFSVFFDVDKDGNVKEENYEFIRGKMINAVQLSYGVAQDYISGKDIDH